MTQSALMQLDKTTIWSPIAAGTTPEWLESLRPKDRVNVFYFAYGLWFYKEMSISYISDKHKHIGIPAAATTKLRGDKSTHTGYFFVNTGLRSTAHHLEDERHGSHDFIGPLGKVEANGVIFVPPGRTAGSMIGEPPPAIKTVFEDRSHYVETAGEEDDWDEYASDRELFNDIETWTRMIVAGEYLGAYWTDTGFMAKEVVEFHLCRVVQQENFWRIVLPSDCTPSELIYRLLRKITLSFDDWLLSDCFEWNHDKEQEARRKGLEMYLPKELSERRRLIERIYRKVRKARECTILLEDGQNLTPAALKELVFLSKTIIGPCFLTGNEDLSAMIKSLKSDWIDVFEGTGEAVDIEFFTNAESFYSQAVNSTGART